jgi:hypothetical protein
MVQKLRFILLLTFIFAFQIAGRTQVYGNEWIKYNQQYYSFKIANSSIHKIEYNTLLSAGITFSSYTHENIQIFGREKEVPLFIDLGTDGTFGPGDFIAFYGERNDGWLDTTLYEDPSWQGNPKYSLYNDTIQFLQLLTNH